MTRPAGAARRAPRRRRPPRRGFALLVVLWAMALLAVLGAQLAATGRSDLRLARNLTANARAEALADAAVAEAAFRLLDPNPARRPPVDGRPLPLALPGGEAAVGLTDEAARIDLNRAAPGLLAALLEVLGAGEDAARALGARAADWIDKDANPKPEGGAELESYAAAGLPWAPPNAPFASVDELGQVLGMTPALLALARPHVTVYGGAEEPAPTLASPVVRAAIALRRERQRLSDRGRGRGGTGAAEAGAAEAGAPTPGAAGNATTGDAAGGAAAAPARPVVRIAASARTADGARADRLAVLRLGADDGSPYEVLLWELPTLPEGAP